MSQRLNGRRVVITGAGGGLGPVAAAAATAEGAEVVLVDVSQERVDDLARTLQPGVVGAYGVDLLDAAATGGFAATLAGEPGGVDAVWHMVGGWRGGPPIEEQPLADWDLLHDLIVRTTNHVARAFTAALLSAPRGRFLTVSSPQATRPTSTNAAYAAMKAASDAITLALADRFAGSAATANVVVVNAILTPAMRAKDPDKPRPGFVPAEAIAEALVWASSDAADTMNGQRLRLTPSGA